MTKIITAEKAKEKFAKLQLKIQKAVLAMDDAKRTFNKLKYFDQTTSYDTTVPKTIDKHPASKRNVTWYASRTVLLTIRTTGLRRGRPGSTQ